MGSKIAITDVGVIYMNGWGVAKDYTKARQSFERAAAASEPVGMNNLGVVYQNGWAVSKATRRRANGTRRAPPRAGPLR